jgi:hypothetical protein
MRRTIVQSLPPQIAFHGEGVVTTSHFQPSLIFTFKGGAYPSGSLAKAFGHNPIGNTIV